MSCALIVHYRFSAECICLLNIRSLTGPTASPLSYESTLMWSVLRLCILLSTSSVFNTKYQENNLFKSGKQILTTNEMNLESRELPTFI